MIPPTTSIQPPALAAIAPAAATPQSAPAGGFMDALRDAFQSVDRMQKTAHASAESLLAGESEDLHRVAMDQQRAAISFDLLLQVRNKAVAAYQEIMRMQV